MSTENKKTLEAYQMVAKNYLNSASLISMKYPEVVLKTDEKNKIFIKEVFKNVPRGSKVLEVGSGSGHKAKFIQELGFTVTASDVADDFLKAIKENGLEPIKFNLLEDNFKDKYQVIFCWRVFVHFTKEDALNALNRSYKALNNNGLFIFSTISRDCKNVNNEWIDFPDEYHLGMERYFNYYSKDDMDEIISKTKFKIFDFHEDLAENNIKWLIYVLKKED